MSTMFPHKPMPAIYEVCIHQYGGRNEMVSFMSLDMAKSFAARYRACIDVEQALVLDGTTGEVLDGLE